MLSWLRVNAPTSFTTCAPMLSFGSQAANIAPLGSAITAMRPASPTSNGPATTVPPSSPALAAASSALATVT